MIGLGYSHSDEGRAEKDTGPNQIIVPLVHLRKAILAIWHKATMFGTPRSGALRCPRHCLIGHSSLEQLSTGFWTYTETIVDISALSSIAVAGLLLS